MLSKVAKITKSNGTDGEFLVSFLDYSPEDIDIKEPVYIYFDGLPVPFFIQSFRPKGSRAYIQLNDVTSLQDAEELTGSFLYLEIGEEGQSEEGLEMEDLVGWFLEDAAGNRIGIITAFEDIPGNPCICVGDVMVPIHEDLIRDVDPEGHILQMDIPEGLI